MCRTHFGDEGTHQQVKRSSNQHQNQTTLVDDLAATDREGRTLLHR
jgi:hypothetical protein